MPLPSLFSPHISRDFPSAITDACANHFFTPSYPLFREQQQVFRDAVERLGDAVGNAADGVGVADPLF